MTHAFDIHLSGYLQVYFSHLPFLLPLESYNIDAAAGTFSPPARNLKMDLAPYLVKPY
jgi:hypothetical protein